MVDRFMEMTDMIRKIKATKTRWLFYENASSQIFVKKSVRYVQLSDGPILQNGSGKKKTNDCYFNYWAKCICVIETMLLFKPLSY